MTRLIKRYGNRKMYDTQASRYVTLDGVAELVRGGDDLRIIDNDSGEDLTAVTFAQIIFEEEKKKAVAEYNFKKGLIIAILSGIVIGHMKMERYVEDFVWQIQVGEGGPQEKLTWTDRVNRAWQSVKDIVGKVWLYVILGIGAGAAIHGYVPEGFLAALMGKQAWWSVPVAVILGAPLYSNAAGIIPVVQALLEKGAALGTVLAFMMSIIGISFPETVILRKVLKPKLIAVFVGVVTIGVIIVGFIFNAIM